MNTLEVAGFLTGVLAVWLTTRENVWCWPVGLVNVAIYAVVFRDAKLYADMGLQVFYAGLCLYGWRQWLHGGTGAAPLAVSRAPRTALLAGTAAGLVCAVVLGLTLKKATDAALPYWDAGTTSFSLVAQFLQTRKWIENWAIWIAVDAVYVGIYVVKGLLPTAGLYAVFLVLAAIGHREWKRSLAA